MPENQKKYGNYSEPPTPGELLGKALEYLHGATAENFSEKIKAAETCICGAKDWIDSTVLFCGERPEKFEQRKQKNRKGSE
jgi:hypothetical protein